MTNKINKRLIGRLFVLIGCIAIVATLATAVSSAETGYTTEYFTHLQYTPADLLSVSMSLPSYGGQRAYFYTNTGFPSNGTTLDEVYGQSTAIPYDLGYGHIYNVSTMTYATHNTWHNTQEGYNEVIVNDIHINPVWSETLSNIETCYYTIRLYFPIAVVSLETLPDYRISLTNSNGVGITGIHVKTTYSYVIPTAVDRGDQVQFLMEPTGQYTFEQDVQQGSSVQLFSTDQYPDKGQTSYVVTDVVSEITFNTEHVLGGGNIEHDPYEYYANEVPIYLVIVTPKAPEISTGITNVSALKDYVFEQISFNDFNLVDWAITQIQGLLSAPLFGFISLGAILFLVVGIALLFFVLKIFLGG